MTEEGSSPPPILADTMEPLLNKLSTDMSTDLIPEQYIEDQGSPRPQHDVAGLPDLEVYHTVNYSEGVSHYHGQASNSVTTEPSAVPEAPFSPKEDSLSGEEVNSYVWQ